MGTLIKNLLGGVWGYVAVAGVAAIVAVSVTRLVDRGIYVPQIDAKQKVFDDYKLAQKDVIANARADAAARQHKQDLIAQAAAVDEAKAQQAAEDANHKLKETIYVHVADTAHCITYGLVRVLNAAAAGASDPGDLGIAPGKSDDACAPVSWRAFAADLIDDYGSGIKNAEQLNRLEDTVRSLHAAAQNR